MRTVTRTHHSRLAPVWWTFLMRLAKKYLSGRSRASPARAAASCSARRGGELSCDGAPVVVAPAPPDTGPHVLWRASPPRLPKAERSSSGQRLDARLGRTAD